MNWNPLFYLTLTLKPKYNTTAKRCLPTCLMAGQALEKTLEEIKKEEE